MGLVAIGCASPFLAYQACTTFHGQPKLVRPASFSDQKNLKTKAKT
jgi:hypothetical protein